MERRRLAQIAAGLRLQALLHRELRERDVAGRQHARQPRRELVDRRRGTREIAALAIEPRAIEQRLAHGELVARGARLRVCTLRERARLVETIELTQHAREVVEDYRPDAARRCRRYCRCGSRAG